MRDDGHVGHFRAKYIPLRTTPAPKGELIFGGAPMVSPEEGARADPVSSIDPVDHSGRPVCCKSHDKCSSYIAKEYAVRGQDSAFCEITGEDISTNRFFCTPKLLEQLDAVQVREKALQREICNMVSQRYYMVDRSVHSTSSGLSPQDVAKQRGWKCYAVEGGPMTVLVLVLLGVGVGILAYGAGQLLARLERVEMVTARELHDRVAGDSGLSLGAVIQCNWAQAR